MSTGLSLILSRQIEPAFSMLMTAVDTCPNDVWTRANGNAPIWQHLVHTAYYLDKWTREPGEIFQPPAFVTEGAVNFTALPNPAVAPDQIRHYLWEIICRCRSLLETTDEATLFNEIEIYGSTSTLLDRILSQIRHSGFHVGCISSIMFLYTGTGLEWAGYDSASSKKP